MEECTAAAHTHAQTRRQKLAARLHRKGKEPAGDLPVEEDRSLEADSQLVVGSSTVVVVAEGEEGSRLGAARNLGSRLRSSSQFNAVHKSSEYNS